MYVFIYFSILLNLLSELHFITQNNKISIFSVKCAIELGRREFLKRTKVKDKKIPNMK